MARKIRNVVISSFGAAYKLYSDLSTDEVAQLDGVEYVFPPAKFGQPVIFWIDPRYDIQSVLDDVRRHAETKSIVVTDD